MRAKLVLCGLTTLVPVLLLAGCGVVNEMSDMMPGTSSPMMQGRAMGARQPVVGAKIEVVSVGTAGYGSSGQVLATTTTDSGGNFSFPPGTYTCPQAGTPVYLLGIGGDTGAGGVNPSAVLGAGLGSCASAQNAFVIMNEVTTTALAFSLSHFFTTILGAANGAQDWFGGPSSAGSGGLQYSKGIVTGNGATIASMVDTAVGAPHQNNSNYAVEGAKINTIANILAACVNTTGSTSSSETTTVCGKLFSNTQNGAVIRPSDTLQAAVQMALHPTSNVTNLFNLVSGQAPFTGLAQAPNDWTIGVSFTTSALGLAVDTGTLTTLDIDSSGRIWFPSNASGHVGAAFFDPTSMTFNGPYNTTGLVHPQQVAVDSSGYAWYNDSATATVAGYLTTAPATTQSLSIPNTQSNTLFVGTNNAVNVGITNGAVFELATIPSSRATYSIVSGVSFSFLPESIAGDIANNKSVVVTNVIPTRMRAYSVPSVGSQTTVLNANDDTGQVIYSGNDSIAVRSFSGSGSGNLPDGLCIYSLKACFNLQVGGVNLQNTAQGMAIAGDKTLWLAEKGDGGVLQVPSNNNFTGINGAIYLNSGQTAAPASEYLHNASNGGTATAPYGIGIDNTGNVWLTNVGCATTDCVPGSFTLTEIVGAAAPTITPVSAQITSGNQVGQKPTQ